MNRMVVALFSRRENAEPIQRTLAGAGFSAELRSEPLVAEMWFVKRSAVTLLEVPAEEFEKAERFLLDWDKRENALHNAIRCPECGSLRVLYPQFAQRSVMTNLALGAAALLRIVEKDFYCQDCHYTWPRRGTRRRRSHGAPYYFIEGIEQTRLPSRAERRRQRGGPVEKPAQ